uniref:Uncharacterized protein n=1 Tax=Knipowitschia caucasica TaxID=637954 RepID=A0AAV2JXI3_KNICA
MPLLWSSAAQQEELQGHTWRISGPLTEGKPGLVTGECPGNMEQRHFPTCKRCSSDTPKPGMTLLLHECTGTSHMPPSPPG